MRKRKKRKEGEEGGPRKLWRESARGTAYQ
jgi:hypothetical protein